MHLKTPLLCAAALLSSAISASPTPGFNGLFEYAELDQYNTTECTLNEDGSGRIYHAKPYSRQCKNIDEKTTSFSYYLALFTQAWAYAEPGCKGKSRKINDWDQGEGFPDMPHDPVCWNVHVKSWDMAEFQRIRSIMMD